MSVTSIRDETWRNPSPPLASRVNSASGLRNRYRRAVDLDLQNVTWDPVLLSLAAFLAVCAIYLLFLRNAVMWGFLCILGIVALFVVQVSPDMLNNR